MKRIWNRFTSWWNLHFSRPKIALIRTALDSAPWDWTYLLQLEQAKFKEMAIYFEQSKVASGWEFQVRDCKLCIKLIDIILEQDEPFTQWLESNYGIYQNESIPEKELFRVPISTHVNTRNAFRFVTDPDTYESDTHASNLFAVDLRQTKAFYLYQKIRLYKLQNLWD
jgi:hypothetical protein